MANIVTQWLHVNVNDCDHVTLCNRMELCSRQTMESTAAAADRNQHNNTLRLGHRAAEVWRWKTELERALEAMILEIDMLEEQRRRARQAKVALGIIYMWFSNIKGLT